MSLREFDFTPVFCRFFGIFSIFRFWNFSLESVTNLLLVLDSSLKVSTKVLELFSMNSLIDSKEKFKNYKDSRFSFLKSIFESKISRNWPWNSIWKTGSLVTISPWLQLFRSEFLSRDLKKGELEKFCLFRSYFWAGVIMALSFWEFYFRQMVENHEWSLS